MPMEHMTGFAAKTIFEKENFRIVLYRDIDGQFFMAKGLTLPDSPGLTAVLYGSWTTYRGTRTLDVDHYEINLPADEASVTAFLTSLHCGIGKKTAHKIYEHCGSTTWDIVENHPEQLLQVSRRIDLMRLKSAFAETVSFRNLMSVFQGIPDITPHHIQLLINKLGEDALEQVHHNPYCVCNYGVGFKDADALANRLLFNTQGPERLAAAIDIVLKRAEEHGHLFLPQNELVDNVKAFIKANSAAQEQIEENIIIATVNFLQGKDIVEENGCVYLIGNYRQESAIAAEIIRLLRTYKRYKSDNLDSYIGQFEQITGIQLDAEQQIAIQRSFNAGLYVITGGPGTGKTTILNGILFCHAKIAAEKHIAMNSVLMAPTGRAARRMAAATGHSATTIHAALRIFEDADIAMVKQLDASLIIVDESSMLDAHIAAILFSKVQSGAQIILVGDVDQLPSVGPGNVLRDIIASDVVPVEKLDTIHRQAAGNPIIVNAEKIKNGDTDIQLDPQKFVIWNPQCKCDLSHAACILYKKCIHSDGIDNVVLMTPTRQKGSTCSDRLNVELQEMLNPHKAEDLELAYGKHVFRMGDKVMQTRNTAMVANGDIGYIQEIFDSTNADDAIVCRVSYGNMLIDYARKDLEFLTLAYAMTVHKAQGSEYNTVLLVIDPETDFLLNRNLLYTAITRGRARVCIIGCKESFDRGVATCIVENRHTHLAERIEADRQHI